MLLQAGLKRRMLSVVLVLSVLSGCALTPVASAGTSLKEERRKGMTLADSAPAVQKNPLQGTASAGQAKPQAAAGYPNDALVVRSILGTLSSFNPHRISLSSEEEMAGYLFGSLYRSAAAKAARKAQALPYHAAALPETTDKITHFIHLRPGMVWSDGTSLTAFDYEASMKRLLDPKLSHRAAVRFTQDLPIRNAAAFYEGRISDFEMVGFKAKDEMTLIVTLEVPIGPLDLSRALQTPFVVKAALYDAALSPDNTQTAYGLSPKDLVFSGAYELEDYRAGDCLRLKKRGKTGFDEINAAFFTPDYFEFRHFSSRLTALEEFQQGKLDAVPVSGALFEELEQDPRLHLVPSNTVWGIYVNAKSPGAKILSDPDFRRALYYGTDRTQIAGGLFATYRPYSGFIGPQSIVTAGSQETVYRKTKKAARLVPKADAYDPEKAEKFAAQAIERVTEPQHIELLIPEGDLQLQEMAELLKQTWQDLAGEEKADFNITALPAGEIHARYADGDYDLGFGAMGQDLYDPWLSLAPFTSKDPRKLDTMTSPRFDVLYFDSTRGPLRAAPAARLEALVEMEAILLSELPQIPLFVSDDAYLISDGLRLPFREAPPGLGLGLELVRASDE